MYKYINAVAVVLGVVKMLKIMQCLINTGLASMITMLENINYGVNSQ